MSLSSNILMKAVMERELSYINLLIDGQVKSEFSKETLTLVSEYLQERIKAAA